MHCESLSILFLRHIAKGEGRTGNKLDILFRYVPIGLGSLKCRLQAVLPLPPLPTFNTDGHLMSNLGYVFGRQGYECACPNSRILYGAQEFCVLTSSGAV